MKILTVSITAFTALTVSASTIGKLEALKQLNGQVDDIDLNDQLAIQNLWSHWKNIFGKDFENEDSAEKFLNFKNRVFLVNSHNKKYKNKEVTYSLGLNQFSHLTDDEFSKLHLMQLPYPEEEMELECPYKFMGADIPEEFSVELDWRSGAKNPVKKTAVTAVKDQASCGSCYSFSATASMESNLCKNGYFDCSTWAGLSEQQVLDCGSYNMKYDATDRPYFGYGGCHGGWQSNVWQYMQWNRGIMQSSDYEYESGNSTRYPDNAYNIGECRYDSAKAIAVPDKIVCGTTNKNGPDDDLMKQAVFAKGALAIGMFVGGTFRDMVDGVYDNAIEDCPNLEQGGINHAMTVVGYGHDGAHGDLDYWIVKNSWGTTFANQGYVKVRKGTNVCGIEGNVGYVDAIGDKEYIDNINSGFPESGTDRIVFGSFLLGLVGFLR